MTVSQPAAEAAILHPQKGRGASLLLIGVPLLLVGLCFAGKYELVALSPGARGTIIFTLLFASYAYFYQAGGWNQNSRFDLVRAVTNDRAYVLNGAGLWVVDITSPTNPRISGVSPFHAEGHLIDLAIGDDQVAGV